MGHKIGSGPYSPTSRTWAHSTYGAKLQGRHFFVAAIQLIVKCYHKNPPWSTGQILRLELPQKEQADARIAVPSSNIHLRCNMKIRPPARMARFTRKVFLNLSHFSRIAPSFLMRVQAGSTITERIEIFSNSGNTARPDLLAACTTDAVAGNVFYLRPCRAVSLLDRCRCAGGHLCDQEDFFDLAFIEARDRYMTD